MPFSVSAAARGPLRAAAAGLAMSLALAAAPAGAHPIGPAAGPVVSVIGEGRTSVVPDLATVSLGVTTQAPTAAQAMADNAARQQGLIDALKGRGIAAEDLQTQGLNLTPMQDYREGQAPVITGYQAQNIVSVRVHDLAGLGPLLDAVVDAGATDVQGVGFSRENDAAALDEARTSAVADARRRAEVMAAATGMTLGPLLSLSEGGGQPGPVMQTAMMARDAGGAATPVETGQLILRAQVTGTWRLVPQGEGAGAPQGGGLPHGPMQGHIHGGPAHGGPMHPQAMPAAPGGIPQMTGSQPAPPPAERAPEIESPAEGTLPPASAATPDGAASSAPADRAGTGPSRSAD